MAYKWIRTRLIDIDGVQYHFEWDSERSVFVERDSREAYDLFLLAHGAFDDRGLLAREPATGVSLPTTYAQQAAAIFNTMSQPANSTSADATAATSTPDEGGGVLPVAQLPLFADVDVPPQLGGLCVVMGKTGVSKSFLAYRFSRKNANRTSLMFAGEPDWRSVGSARQALRMVRDYLGQRDSNDNVRFVVIDSIKELAFGGNELASGGVNVGLSRELSNLSALAARAGVWVIATLNPIHDDVADVLAAQIAASVQCLLNVSNLDVATETFKCSRVYRVWRDAQKGSDPYYERLQDDATMAVKELAPFLESLVGQEQQPVPDELQVQQRATKRARQQHKVQQPTVVE